ncbi:hypothetical protein A3860_39330 [Niastella vici]|uniref:Uncharacterized protein n=1 Tax=Niastella vici TaxID=1703345 RepID=A0A1V9FKF1_9BACT|nr:hypothetical protein [Niastella vici]OQP58825.1 hypothetical protein A3860_39330 [Niastella vici]
MKKIYLSFFLLLTGVAALAQDTTAPVLNKSNRIILHFTDTTGKFTQLARLLIDRGYDIDMKDRELGILRTQPSPLRGASFWTDRVEIKTIFKDSTITFSGVYSYETYEHNLVRYEVFFSKKPDKDIMRSWEEMQTIAELLKPAFITYSTVDVTGKVQKVESWYKRNN